MTKLYTNTDVAITLTPGTGFTMSDVVEAGMVMTLANGDNVVTLSSTANQIILNQNDMTVNISDSDVSEAGVYQLRITFTDSNGNIRGLTPNTETLRFW